MQNSISVSSFRRRNFLIGAAFASLFATAAGTPAKAGVETVSTASISGLGSPSAAFPRVFAITPERRALLNTIRYAEGTWVNGDDLGYRVMFGGGLMDSLERHPDRVIRRSRYASAAAGAYQFMPFTWSMASRVLGLPGFGPHAQDQAALFLIQRRGALALADQGQLTPHLAARLAPEWASFPTLRGHSFYGQPVKRFADLRRFYEQNLAQLRGNSIPPPESVASAPSTTCQGDRFDCLLESIANQKRGN